MENVFDYSRTGDRAELIIRGPSGEKMDTFKWNLSDKKLEKKIYGIVKRKYGMFKPEISDMDKDLDWLKR